MLSRVFLDTNVYIVGVGNPDSVEWKILQWLGFDASQHSTIEVIVSSELIEQILRVAKRLQGKDWASSIVGRMWKNLNLRYVLIEDQECSLPDSLDWIPREDVGVYLTAKLGGAECFVSANYKLIRAAVTGTHDFECLTPERFSSKYLT